MAASEKTLRHGEITGQILNGFNKRVYAELGYGFLENVYEKAMAYELEQRNLRVVRQQRITVYYRGIVVGEYVADLVVNEKVVVELKASAKLTLKTRPNC